MGGGCGLGVVWVGPVATSKILDSPHSHIKDLYWRLVGPICLMYAGENTLCGAHVSVNLCKCVCACAYLSKQEAIYGKFRIGEAKCVLLPPVSLFYSSTFYFWSVHVTIEWLMTCKESELVSNEALRQNKHQAACREEEGTKLSLRLSDDWLILFDVRNYRRLGGYSLVG